MRGEVGREGPREEGRKRGREGLRAGGRKREREGSREGGRAQLYIPHFFDQTLHLIVHSCAEICYSWI